MLELKDQNYYIEKLWFMINKDKITKEQADTQIRTEILNEIKSKKLYQNFSKYLEPLESALNVIHWQYWNFLYDPPKKKEPITYDLNVHGIYEIVNIKNNKRYIGLSKNIKERWKSHISSLNSGRHHCEALKLDWEEYGSESFRFNVIQVIENNEMLGYYERYWWKNSIGEKYNNDSHMITIEQYKIKTLEMRIHYLENELKKYKL